MRTISFILAAGERKELDMTADFFYLRETSYPVDIVLQKAHKPASEEALGVEAGYHDRPLTGFDKVIIKSAQAQTIKVDISSGEAGYDRAVTTLIGNLLGITNPVTIVNQGDVYGAGFKSIAAIAANGVETVFSGAANVNGAVLYAASLSFYNNAATPRGALVAKATAPASVVDGDVIIGNESLAIGLACFAKLETPLKIPAGKGLYFISDTADTGAITMRKALYKLL